MSRRARRILIGILVIISALAVVIAIEPRASWLASIAAGLAIIGLVTLNMLSGTGRVPARPEPESVGELSEARQRELIRGTSLFLREMNYRYSIRYDTISDSMDRQPFSVEVNTVQLGFIPAIISDNTTEREGLGYVAYVHDGTRWRGPGLPCPGNHSDAVRHAAKCVSPLATDEETAI